MTKRQLLENISSAELTEWAAYFRVLEEENESETDRLKKERAAYERAKKG